MLLEKRNKKLKKKENVGTNGMIYNPLASGLRHNFETQFEKIH